MCVCVFLPLSLSLSLEWKEAYRGDLPEARVEVCTGVPRS